MCLKSNEVCKTETNTFRKYESSALEYTFPLMLNFVLTCLMIWGSRINHLLQSTQKLNRLSLGYLKSENVKQTTLQPETYPWSIFVQKKKSTVSCTIIIVKQLNCMEVQLAYVLIRAKPNCRTLEWRKRNRKRWQCLSQHGPHPQYFTSFSCCFLNTRWLIGSGTDWLIFCDQLWIVQQQWHISLCEHRTMLF